MSGPLENPKRPKPWLAIGVVASLTILALNLVGLLIYRSNQLKSETVVVGPRTEPTSLKQLAVEQREKGVLALRSGDYAKALKNFQAALELDRDVADAAVLMDVAQRLRDSESETRDVAETGLERGRRASDAPVELAQRTIRRPTPRPARNRARARAESREAVPKTGHILVTTVPDRILIEVDGKPVELSPARLPVAPGSHRVRLRRGPTVLLDRKVEVQSGQTRTINEDFTARVAGRSAPAAATDATRSLATDPDLDLLAIVDQTRPPGMIEPAPPPPAATSPRQEPRPGSGPPGLLVFWPGGLERNVERSLGSELSGIEVQVVSSSADFRRALEAGPDAVMAESSILQRNGMAPSLRSSGAKTMSGYVAASLGTRVARSELSSSTIGIVDELGRRRAPVFVARLLGTKSAPTLRRVAEVEDLLPLLQFSIARAVLVREPELNFLQSRTTQKIYTIPLPTPEAQLAVAFPSGGRGPMVERALLRMPERTKKALGVDSWKR